MDDNPSIYDPFSDVQFFVYEDANIQNSILAHLIADGL